MADPTPTVLALKQNFVASQARILSQNTLRASRAWHAANDTSDDGLTPHAVEYALFRANHALLQHCRRVYNPQATRHVAEQIDQLYFHRAHDDSERDNGHGGEQGVVGLETDLTDTEFVANLPDPWPFDRQIQEAPAHATQYSNLAGQISSLCERRTQIQDRVDRLRGMNKLLQPFCLSDADASEPSSGGGLQENLITRGGELERELERMKVLLARVGGRVALLPNGSTSLNATADSEATWVSNQHQSDEKLDIVLDGL